MNWLEHLQQQLDERRSQNLFRARRQVRPLTSTHIQIENRTLVNFASNDYLGLSHHPRVIEAVSKAAATHGAGSGASALISGHTDLHAQAEAKLADWKSTQSAVLLPSGYQANLAAVQALSAIGQSYRDGVRYLLDKLSHASLIDAVRATGDSYRVFPHNHLGKLARLLEESPAEQLQVVVTESIFSMDGDQADLPGLIEFRKKFGFVLLLDEAHASGVYGKNGNGLAAELGLSEQVDVFVVTLGKALGCGGGAVCGSKLFCDAIANFGRAHIYTTQLPATTAAGVSAAIDVLRDEPARQQRVRVLARRVRTELSAKFEIPAGDSPIVPIILGAEDRAMKASEKLFQSGFLVPAVRPPTVPPNSSRLRLTISSEHRDEEIAQVIQFILSL